MVGTEKCPHVSHARAIYSSENRGVLAQLGERHQLEVSLEGNRGDVHNPAQAAWQQIVHRCHRL